MFQIYVDSGANIPALDVKKYGIKVITFMNEVGGKMVPGFDINLDYEQERAAGKKYYDAVRQGVEIKTSLINTATFMDNFKETLDKGEDFIYISLSKNISGTFNAAKLAIEDLKEEYPDRIMLEVDALNASLGQGFHAIYASILRDKGVDIKEVSRLLEEMVPYMNGMFTVGDLKYLAKTGRISGAAATVGNVLNIKPILRGNKEGFIVQFKKCRGRKKSLDELVELVCNNVIESEKQILGIAHADAYEDSLYVTEEILKRATFKEVINTSYDFCTGSHVGPDTIALFYIASDRELMGRKDEIKHPEIFKYL